MTRAFFCLPSDLTFCPPAMAYCAVCSAYPAACLQVRFANGTRKLTAGDGGSCVFFTNGDVKRSAPDGRCEYFYAEVDTWHTTHASGIEARARACAALKQATHYSQQDRATIDAFGPGGVGAPLRLCCARMRCPEPLL